MVERPVLDQRTFATLAALAFLSWLSWEVTTTGKQVAVIAEKVAKIESALLMRTVFKQERMSR